jgi:hypothetical protein
MFDDLHLNDSQLKEVEDFGYLRLPLDEALELLKDHKIGVSALARALGMQRSNLRSQFSKGCELDFYPNTGEVKMVRVEEVLKTGSL